MDSASAHLAMTRLAMPGVAAAAFVLLHDRWVPLVRDHPTVATLARDVRLDAAVLEGVGIGGSISRPGTACAALRGCGRGLSFE